MKWILFTPARAAQAEALSAHTDFKVRPRAIDRDGCTHSGLVIPAQVIEGDYAPFWHPHLSDLPLIEAEGADLFRPPEA